MFVYLSVQMTSQGIHVAEVIAECSLRCLDDMWEDLHCACVEILTSEETDGQLCRVRLNGQICCRQINSSCLQNSSYLLPVMTVVRFVRYLGWILFLPLIKILREKCLQVLCI